MDELKAALGRLRLDRDPAPTHDARSPWFVWAGGFLVAAVGAGLAAPLVKPWVSLLRPSAPIETLQPTVSGGAAVLAGTPILTATGYVVARRKAIVSSKIPGRLAKLEVDEGAHVTDGQVIARLEDAEFRAQAARARASLYVAEMARIEQERQLAIAQRLVGQNAAPTNDRDLALSRATLAGANVAQALAEVQVQDAFEEGTVIRAPFSGTVVKKMAEVGESVGPLPPGANISTATGAIFAIADTDSLEAEADIAEANVSKLREGQPAQVVADAFPEQKFAALLRSVMPIADRTKATVLVRVTILQADRAHPLKPEMAAKIVFVERAADPSATPTPRTVSVPRHAIAHRGTDDVVFAVRAGRAEATRVTLGEARGDRVVVAGGLGGNEVLVATPDNALKDGDAVKVTP